MNTMIKGLSFGVLIVALFFVSYPANAQSWQNSPRNWQNSPNNPTAGGIYDNQGNRQGYAVQRQDGSGVNLFTNDGKRMGYQNYQRR